MAEAAMHGAHLVTQTHTHTSMEQSLVHFGVHYPPKDPLTLIRRPSDLLSHSPFKMLTLFSVSFFVFQGVQQKRPSAAQNAILRRYFLELTQSFIIPLVTTNVLFFYFISIFLKMIS